MKESDKVVCIDDDFSRTMRCPFYQFSGVLPVEGKVYTIEKVIADNRNDRPGEVGLRLTGTTCFRADKEVGYSSFRFRKLDEMKSSHKTPEQILEGLLQ